MYRFSLYILSTAIEAMRKETRKFYLRETGGILIGYWSQDKTQVVITHATGSGSDSFHGFSYFEPDTKYCQKKLNKVFDATSGGLTYLGDWHSHPWNFLNLSPTDLNTMKNISEDKDFKCKNPIIAVSSYCLNKFHLKNFYWINKKTKPKLIKPIIINEIPGFEIPSL